MRVKSKRMMFAAAALTMVWLVGIALAANSTDISTRSSRASFSPSTRSTAPRDILASIPFDRAFARQGGQPAAQRKPVMSDDIFKNVQVLKGIPVDDFMGTMGIMAASLAFCCRDCHPGAGSDIVVWEDDTPRKRTARKMVTMVQNINKENFNGRPVVTCWTCHRGRDFPVMTMELDTVYGEANVQLDDVLTPVKGMPPAGQIIDKYVQAIGGTERVAGIRSFVASGTGEEFSGQGGVAQVEIFAKAPDQRHVPPLP